jgi:hypothetical protein
VVLGAAAFRVQWPVLDVIWQGSVPDGWVLVACISRPVGELGTERGEAGGLIGVGCVAVGGAAVAVQIVRLVEFPDLVPQGVLDGVTALLAQSVGPDVAVVDEVGAS